MKIKNIIAVLALLIGNSFAANITVSDALGAGDTANFHANNGGVTNRVLLKSSGGTILNTGAAQTGITTKYLLGYFVGFDSGIGSALSGDNGGTLFSALNDPARFVPLGLGVAGLGSNIAANQRVNPANGRLANTMTSVTYLDGAANAASSGGINRGTRLFMILLNQESTTQTLSTEFGLFSATNWLIPATGSANITLSLKDVDTAGEVFQGGLGSLVLAPTIPEASSTALALLAGLGLMSRRRR